MKETSNESNTTKLKTETVESNPQQDISNRYISVNLRKLLLVVIIIALPLLGFWAGIAYEHGKSPNIRGQMAGRFGTMQGPGGMRNRADTLGTVSSVNSTSITVTSRFNNTDKTYSITSDTKITNNGSAASASDIKTGDTVRIIPNTSDKTQAATIELNPSFGPQASASSQNDSMQSGDMQTMSQ